MINRDELENKGLTVATSEEVIDFLRLRAHEYGNSMGCNAVAEDTLEQTLDADYSAILAIWSIVKRVKKGGKWWLIERDNNSMINYKIKELTEKEIL